MKTYAYVIAVALAALTPFSAVATPDFMKQNIGSLDCGINEIAKFNGSAWECSSDLDALSQAIEEVGDLGCSATQQDNSVLIECGDGTAGVIAGAGTVVLYPEGQIGQVPPIEYNTGPIVAADATGAVLGQVTGMESFQWGDTLYIRLFEDMPWIQGRLLNFHETQQVVFSPWTNTIYFLSEDCSGPAFLSPNNNYGLGEIEGRLFISFPLSSGESRILFKSRRDSGSWVPSGIWTNGEYSEVIAYQEPSACILGDIVTNATLASEYFPAPEIANAVYPVRVEQLP